MVILFFDSEGHVLQHWLPQTQAVNGVYYENALQTHLRNVIQKKRTEFLKVSASRQCTCDDWGTSRH
jgi:hypothetical protein